MALPTIIFNSSTGSDTVASGAGPSTALTGTGASLSTSTSIDLSADSPDLSGVAIDGSAVLYVNTSSGRKFFKITNTNNSTKVVTVANASTVTESGKTWAIGGKRATFNATSSRLLFSADVLPGWIIETETTQSITASGLTCGVSGDTTNGPIIVRGSSGQDHPTMTQSANAEMFGCSNINYWQWKNLKLTCSNGTRSSAYGLLLRGFGYLADDVIFGDATNKLLTAAARSGGAVFLLLTDCEIRNCTDAGIIAVNNGVTVIADGCYIHDNTLDGIELGNNSAVMNCIITGNGADGINCISGPDVITIMNNTVYGNTGDGLDTSNIAIFTLNIKNNIFANNGNYGWRANAGQFSHGHWSYNNFYNNTSGARLNISAGTNDLAVNPQFTNAAGANYSLSTYVLRALGFPSSSRFIGANQGATKSYTDIGAAQRQEQDPKYLIMRR